METCLTGLERHTGRNVVREEGGPRGLRVTTVNPYTESSCGAQGGLDIKMSKGRPG